MIKKIFYTVLIIIGTLGILNTIYVAKVSVGLSAGNLMQGAIGLIFIIYAILKFRLGDVPIIKHDLLRRIVIIGICAFMLLFTVVETLILTHAYSKKHERTDVNYVVVLGCAIFPDGQLTLTLAKRLNAAYNYLEDHPDTVCIVSGGQGANEPTTEAYAMAEYLESRGIDESRIIKEEESTNSKENLQFSKKIMEQYDKDLSVAIVTSDFHIYRSLMLAKDNGLDAIGMPSYTSWYIWPSSFLREFMAVIKSAIFDLN